MVERIGPVDEVSSASDIDANVYRTDYIPSGQSGGITVKAVDIEPVDTLQGTVADGRFLDEASGAYPTVVLGAVAAERLGITDLDGNPLVWLGDQWFGVIGILEQFDLSADLDRAALVGWRPLQTYFESRTCPTSSTFERIPSKSTM